MKASFLARFAMCGLLVAVFPCGVLHADPPGASASDCPNGNAGGGGGGCGGEEGGSDGESGEDCPLCLPPPPPGGGGGGAPGGGGPGGGAPPIELPGPAPQPSQKSTNDGMVAGNPIEVGHGVVVRHEFDFSLPVKHGLALNVERRYSSRIFSSENISGGTMFGSQWWCGYDMRIYDDTSVGSDDFILLDDRANWHHLELASGTHNAAGAVYRARLDQGAPMQMTIVGSAGSSRTYEVVFGDRSMVVFNSVGRIKEWHANVNNSYDDHLSFEYDGEDRLWKVHAPTGDDRYLEFVYLVLVEPDPDYETPWVKEVHLKTTAESYPLVFYAYDGESMWPPALESVRWNSESQSDGIYYEYGSFDGTTFTAHNTTEFPYYYHLGRVSHFHSGGMDHLAAYFHDDSSGQTWGDSPSPTKSFAYHGGAWHQIVEVDYEGFGYNSTLTYKYGNPSPAPQTAFSVFFSRDFKEVRSYTNAAPKAKKRELLSGANSAGTPRVPIATQTDHGGTWQTTAATEFDLSNSSYLDKYRVLSTTKYGGPGETKVRTTEYEYNSTFPQMVETVTDPLGIATEYTIYSTSSSDARYGKVTIVESRGVTTTFSYYASGNKKGLLYQVATPDGTTTYDYNDRGDTTSVTSPDGNVVTRTYNDFGQVVTETASHLGTTTYNYSVDSGIPSGEEFSPSRLIKVTDPNGDATKYLYYTDGLLHKTVDDDNEETVREYDTRNRLVSVTNPEGDESTYAYDAIDRLVAFKDGKQTALGGSGEATEYEYDEFGRLKKETDPGNYYTQYFYTVGTGCGTCGGNGASGGEVSRKRLKDGTYASFDYAFDGKLRSVDYESVGASDSKELVYGYKDDGRLWFVEDKRLGLNEGYYVWEYYDSGDDKGRLKRFYHPEQYYQEYFYGAEGKLEAYRDVDGGLIEYESDALGRLDSLTDPFLGVTDFVYATTSDTSHPVGAMKQLAYANGTKNVYSYDTLARLTKASFQNSSSTELDYVELHYDNLGLIDWKKRKDGANARKTVYEYDAAYRLTKEENRNTSDTAALAYRQYAYDAAGNRATMRLWNTASDDKTTTYTYGTRNQMVSNTGYFDTGTNDTEAMAFVFDSKGNMTERIWSESAAYLEKRWDYGWNEDDRMVSARYREIDTQSEQTEVDNLSTYLYDYAGRRLIKRAGAANQSGERARYFFNGLTEEVTKTSVGTHADTSFQRLVKWGAASTSGGPKTEPGTTGPTGWTVVADTDRRRDVYEIDDDIQSDGTIYSGSGNGYDVQGYRTFATWLKGTQSAASIWFSVHLDTSTGRKAIYYRPDQSTSSTVGAQRTIGIHGQAGDFDHGQWVRLERDFVADMQAAWPGTTLTRVTGIEVRSKEDLMWMDGLSFSNSLTVEHNVLKPGVIGHIARNRTYNTSTWAATDRWFHYDQVGTVMNETDSTQAVAATKNADAWGNTLDSWSNMRRAVSSAWGMNTKYSSDAPATLMYQRWYFSEFGAFASAAPLPPYSEHVFGFANTNPVSLSDPRGECVPCLLVAIGAVLLLTGCEDDDWPYDDPPPNPGCPGDPNNDVDDEPCTASIGSDWRGWDHRKINAVDTANCQAFADRFRNRDDQAQAKAACEACAACGTPPPAPPGY